MTTSSLTWCRHCGHPLALPGWRRLAGLQIATCGDLGACAARLLPRDLRAPAQTVEPTAAPV